LVWRHCIYPFASRYSFESPLCSIWVFSLQFVHAVDPRLPHRPSWICNTSSNTNRPSQMSSSKCKHTNMWACTANKCDETQIYWRTVTCASRHGLCERVAFEMSDSDLFASFRSMPTILGFSLFFSWPCFFSIIYVILLFLSYIYLILSDIFFIILVKSWVLNFVLIHCFQEAFVINLEILIN